nr:MAG TPA: hypothetical protein [Caudoviricetes sp.]
MESSLSTIWFFLIFRYNRRNDEKKLKKYSELKADIQLTK